MVRLLGKRGIGSLSAFDLIVTLILGEVVDEVIFGDVELTAGLTAIGAIAVLHLAVSWLSYASPGARRLLEGDPTALVRDGRFVQRGLRQERISEEELWSLLRQEEVDREDLASLEIVRLEPDGKLSVRRCDPEGPAGEGVRRRAMPPSLPERRRVALSLQTEPASARAMERRPGAEGRTWNFRSSRIFTSTS